MQAVRQLDQDHPDIIIESQEDTLEILGLAALFGKTGFVLRIIVQDSLDLGESLDQGGYLLSEEIAYVI